MYLKLVGIAAAFALGLVLTFLTLVALALAGVGEETLVALGSCFAAPMAGLLIVAWKRPEMFASPLHSLWPWLNARLSHPAQRALFLLSLFATIPWVASRVIGETFNSSTIAEYARSAYYPLVNTVFELGRWSYEPTWYDWLILLALLGFLLALFWHSLVEPLSKWIRGIGNR